MLIVILEFGSGGGTVIAKNNLSYNNGTDFSGLDPSSDYNFSKDDTAVGDHSIHGDSDGKTPDFVSTTPGSEDFRLQNTSDAIGVGTDLSSIFTDDIDGTDRPHTDYTQDDNCVGAWLFTTDDYNGGSGTSVADASGENNTGNFKGAGEPAWYNTSLPKVYMDWAVDFDGSDDYINCGSNAVIDNLTSQSFVAWVKIDNTGVHWFFEKYTGSDAVYAFYIGSTNSIKFQHQGANTIFSNSSDNTYTDTTNWHHIAFTWDGTGEADNIHIYMDGNEVSYKTRDDGAAPWTSDETKDFKIGISPTGTYKLNGKMGETALFNDELSFVEINNIMNYGLEPADSGSWDIGSDQYQDTSTTHWIMVVE